MSQHGIAILADPASEPDRPFGAHPAQHGPARSERQSDVGMAYAAVGQEPRAALAFDGFLLRPMQRLLLNGDEPVRLGSRALDLLIALARRPGDVISKQELIAAVWPDTYVGEGNLKVQIAALRRALREGESGRRYISTVAGRGYCFVASVTMLADVRPAAPRAENEPRRHNLAGMPAALTGREDAVRKVVTRLSDHRLLTLVGPGGIGKTSVAAAAATALIDDYADGVWFVDLAAVSDPQLVSEAVASAIGLDNAADGPDLLPFLADKRLLLVLDTCEHVVDAIAALVFHMLLAAPGVRVLATSREPLRVSGEYLYRLPPLEQPRFPAELSAEEALAFPAVRLLAERTACANGGSELRDADASVVVDLCRKLDGLPLAIELAAAELAAAEIGAYGLRGGARPDPLQVPRRGSPTPVARHRSLRASFDWSWATLRPRERQALRRLSVFAGSFTLQDAARLPTGATTAATDESRDGLAALTAKSLLVMDADGTEPRFRMPNLTRFFAFEKLLESGEADAMSHLQREPARVLRRAA